MKEIILKILSIIYLLFSMCLLIINFYNFNIYNVIGIIISTLIIIFLTKKMKINKILFIILIFITLLIRIIPFFIEYSNINNDYSFFLNSARNFAQNKPLSNSYLGLFPYLYSYIFLLGNLMKLISTSYNTVLIFNLIFELLGAIFIYLLFSKINKDNRNKAIFIYLLNPFNILWSTFCCPVIIVNTMLIICTYLIYILKEVKRKKRKILLSILLGFLLSVANALRPIVIILFIATLMWYLIYTIKNKEIFRKYIKIILLTLTTYMFTNCLINNYIQKEIGMNLPSSKSGWTIYVGSNYETYGMWNAKDSEHLTNIYETHTNDETHEILKKEGINRYKELGLKNIIHLIKKTFILGNDIEVYSANELFTLNEYKLNNNIRIIINIVLSIYWYFLLISNIIISSKHVKNKRYTLLLPVAIFGFGLFLSTLIVEVSPRYFTPILVPLMIYNSLIFSKEVTYEK